MTDPWTRRFQVLNEDGRSQDIRTWKKEIEIVNAMEQFPRCHPAAHRRISRREPAVMGSKLPMRKGRLGTFSMQRLRDQHGAPQIDDEDELLDYAPVRDSTRPRAQNCIWGKERNRKSRTWKSQTSNTSQWGRHTRRAVRLPFGRDSSKTSTLSA